MIEKKRPKAKIAKKYNADGRGSWYEIDYFCPTCGQMIREFNCENACDNCGTFYDWSKEAKIHIERSIIWE